MCESLWWCDRGATAAVRAAVRLYEGEQTHLMERAHVRGASLRPRATRSARDTCANSMVMCICILALDGSVRAGRAGRARSARCARPAPATQASAPIERAWRACHLITSAIFRFGQKSYFRLPSSDQDLPRGWTDFARYY